eukprot:Mrub_12974.p1 GENE.Mrub_12974~~Mrub_12974.p1  ORF type:complete len:166 (+),score=38.15 Mrub_12974:24-521(+)
MLTILIFQFFIIYSLNSYRIKSANNNSEYLNVYGRKLEKCSGAGMALTGFTRTGECTDHDDDAGSHHICIDLQSMSANFCEQTGQPNWCGESMQCHQGPGECKPKNWCVCEWAFASYIHNAGGCGKINDIDCNSINKVALTHYESKLSDAKIKNAYDCIKSRCGL